MTSLAGPSVTRALMRTTNPAILPIPSRSAGNNVPKSLHKTRRTWKANMTRTDWPVNLLASSLGYEPPLASSSSTSSSSRPPQSASSVSSTGSSEDNTSPTSLQPLSSSPSHGGHTRMPMMRGVKMQTRRLKDVEKAGGLEGLLLSRPAKHFTPFGRQLRARVFAELERIRDERQAQPQNPAAAHQ